MARLSQQQNQQTRADIELEPDVLLQLEGNLSTFDELKMQLELISAAIDVEKETIREVMEAHHIESMKAGGHSLAIVRGVTNTVDWKQLRAMGVTDAMKENATVTKPKKSYLDIRGKDDAPTT